MASAHTRQGIGYVIPQMLLTLFLPSADAYYMPSSVVSVGQYNLRFILEHNFLPL